jgi:MYXO-CTERM domain-containing protein
MRLPTLLIAFALAFAAQAAGIDESFQGAPQRGAAPQPSQYSFADLYRLALAGPASVASAAAPGFFIVSANDAPVRVAASAPPAQFSVADAPKPELWLLLLSGLAAAVWVARRRLGYPF